MLDKKGAAYTVLAEQKHVFLGSFLVQEHSHFGVKKGITPWLYKQHHFWRDGISRETQSKVVEE